LLIATPESGITTIDKSGGDEKKEVEEEESNLLFNYTAFFAHSFPQYSETPSSGGGQGGDSPGVGQNILEIYGFHPSTMTEDLEALLGLFGTQVTYHYAMMH